jgi:ADP-dependent NAD(P)H-hydrate dehydratase / NAD(P)H-hydrate epimerase
MRILKKQKIRSMDEYCIKVLNIPEIILMENSALKILKNIDLNNNSFSIICGSGNNGGDGLALARHLLNKGKIVTIFLVSFNTNLSEAAQINLNILKNLKADIILLKNEMDLSILKDILVSSEYVVDCLFGTGLSRDIEGLYIKIITANTYCQLMFHQGLILIQGIY